MSGYWYMATPYTLYKNGLDEAHVLACKSAAYFAKRGIAIYSPIAATHPIASHGKLDHKNHDLWLPFDRPIAKAALGMIIVTMEGWKESEGIRREIKWFRKAKKPIMILDVKQVLDDVDPGKTD